jgi:ribosomal-protein-alanine N-acetyltransferase
MTSLHDAPGGTPPVLVSRTGGSRYQNESASIEIVPMRRRHLRGVLRIEAHNVHRPWSLGLFMSELRQADARVYAVALSGGAVVGFAGELFSVTDAHITTLATHPDWRRAGIGTRLLLVLARQAAARGMTALTLEVAASNEPAQALYRRFGLAPVGVRKNYYEDLREDAVIMWAHDLDQDAYRDRLDRIEAGLGQALHAPGWPT